MPYYKVLREVPTLMGKPLLLSAAARGRFCLTYTLGDWIVPENPPLYLFSDLALARAFSKPVIGKVIYECELPELVSVPTLVPDTECPDFEQVAGQWYGADNRFWDNPNLVAVPKGTVCANSIRLTRHVW